jgi:hypothetical protein
MEMKQIRQHYPRRGEMLATAFKPLSEEDFRKLVTSGVAFPGHQGTGLWVAKWSDRPGHDIESFLVTLHAQGASLEARTFKSDVNVRVVRKKAMIAGKRRTLTSARKPRVNSPDPADP